MGAKAGVLYATEKLPPPSPCDPNQSGHSVSFTRTISAATLQKASPMDWGPANSYVSSGVRFCRIRYSVQAAPTAVMLPHEARIQADNRSWQSARCSGGVREYSEGWGDQITPIRYPSISICEGPARAPPSSSHLTTMREGTSIFAATCREMAENQILRISTASGEKKQGGKAAQNSPVGSARILFVGRTEPPPQTLFKGPASDQPRQSSRKSSLHSSRDRVESAIQPNSPHRTRQSRVNPDSRRRYAG